MVFYLLAAYYDDQNPVPWARLAILPDARDCKQFHSFCIQKLKKIDPNNSLPYYIEAYDKSFTDVDRCIKLIHAGNSKMYLDFYTTPLPTEYDLSLADDGFSIKRLLGMQKTVKDLRYILDMSSRRELQVSMFFTFRNLTRKVISHGTDLVDKGMNSNAVFAYESLVDMARKVVLSRPTNVRWMCTGFGILNEKDLVSRLRDLYHELHLDEKAARIGMIESISKDTSSVISTTIASVYGKGCRLWSFRRKHWWETGAEMTGDLQAKVEKEWCFNIGTTDTSE